MVLETRLIYIYLPILFLFSSSCHANSENITDKAEIKSYQLILKNKGKTCYLNSRYKGTKSNFILKMKPPCYFLRKGNKEPQSFEFKDVYVDATILIVGSPISHEKRNKWNLDKNLYCGESRQAILIKQSGLTISDKVLDGGVVCKDKGADEKDFWYFAH